MRHAKESREQSSRPLPPLGQEQTLIKLLVVTTMIGLVALMLAAGFMGARERAMISSARAELRAAVSALEYYQITQNGLPGSFDELVDAGLFTGSVDILYCEFQRVPAAASEAEHVVISAHHRNSNTIVTTHYPTWESRIEETRLDGLECEPLVDATATPGER